MGRQRELWEMATEVRDNQNEALKAYFQCGHQSFLIEACGEDTQPWSSSTGVAFWC